MRHRYRFVWWGMGGLLIVLTGLVIAGSLYQVDRDSFRSARGVGFKAEKIAHRLCNRWGTYPSQFAIQNNPEWDFMSRTFLVLSLVNIGLRQPDRADSYRTIVDRIIGSTLQIEKESGFQSFLLHYGRTDQGWVIRPVRSQFVDGEIALMLAARNYLDRRDDYRVLLRERIEGMMARMKQSPVLCAESYPNECWIFCNSIGIAAMVLGDCLDGTDHHEFVSAWIQSVKSRLIDPKTGLLISAFTIEGKPVPCGSLPEGSSLWMTCHMLQVIDSELARVQYDLARSQLAGQALAFGYSREWPGGLKGNADIDSDYIVPFFRASPSASGLAMVGAAAFGDSKYYQRLLNSLVLLAGPVETNDSLYFRMSNEVGDSVVLYSMTLGPLWAEVEKQKAIRTKD